VRQLASAQLALLALLPLIAVSCYQLDGIFIGATRSIDMMWTTLVAVIGFVLVLTWMGDTNRGLWVAFLVFFALRGIGLAVRYPALEHSLVGKPDLQTASQANARNMEGD